MRANTVSVASEWYSAKRNKPSRSCEANGRPYGKGFGEIHPEKLSSRTATG